MSYPAVVWSMSKNQLSWHHCHNEAFRRVGGVTATVRVDNEKTAVARGAGAWGVINASYRRYAQMLRFHVDACPPRDPQTKGKIERSVRTQRFGADPSGSAWRDLAELQAFSDERIDADARRLQCLATGALVYESWLEERELLTPLPEPSGKPLISLRPVRSPWMASSPSKAATTASRSPSYARTWRSGAARRRYRSCMAARSSPYIRAVRTSDS